MTRFGLATMSLWLTVAAAHALPTFTVTNTANGSTGSFRRAIQQANALPGTGPCFIVFDPSLKGRTIKPVTYVLPAVTREGVQIDADIDNDQEPDVVLDGSGLWSVPQGGSQHGLTILASSCLVRGFSIVGFPDDGILAMNLAYLTVDFCHLGVDLAGTRRRPNGGYDLAMQNVSHAQVGHSGYFGHPTQANLVGSKLGFGMWDCASCSIQGNYFGIRNDGAATLGTYDGTGVTLSMASQGCTDNSISYNGFAGVSTGVSLTQAGTSGNRVLQNTFGLAADGTTVLPGLTTGVAVAVGANNNVVGPGNVFVGEDATGVSCGWTGTIGNAIQGNAFGSDANRTAQRPLLRGVLVENGAGAQTVGGDVAASGNLFLTNAATGSPIGVEFRNCGNSSHVRYNTFGTLASGMPPGRTAVAVLVHGPKSVWVADNEFAGPNTGVRVSGTGASALILHNRFHDCTYAAVVLQSLAHAYLGDATSDLGGGRNTFRQSNLWTIRNETPNPVPAELNDFITTTKAAIDKRIWDQLDSPTLGLVDYVPLAGGIIPAASHSAPVTVSALTAAPAGRGVEVCFTLSAPAQVSVVVLNLAGRAIARPLDGVSCPAGMSRASWSGRSLTGTQAPNGRYLVRVTAQTTDGRIAAAESVLALR